MPQVASEAQASNPSPLRPKATLHASHGAGREAASSFSSFFEHAGSDNDTRIGQKRIARADNRRDSNPASATRDALPARTPAKSPAKSPVKSPVKVGFVGKDASHAPTSPPDERLQPAPARDDEPTLTAYGVDGVKTGDAPPPDPATQTGDATKQAGSIDAASALAAQQLAEALAADPAQTDSTQTTATTATVVPTAPQPVAAPGATQIIDITASAEPASDAGATAQIDADQAKAAVNAAPTDIGDEPGTPATATAGKTDEPGHAAARQAGAVLKSAEHATAGEQPSESTGIKTISLPEQAEHGQSEAATHHAAHAEKPAGQQATANRPDADAVSAASPPPGLQTTPGAAAAVANVHGMQVSAAAYAADHGKTEQTQAVPIEGLGVEIAVRAKSGKNQFDIRLDPPELGRIEVRLHVDDKGQVTSRLVADRLDTLDLLRRDAAGLERALQDAGLKTSSNGMQFSLRDHSGGQQGQFDQSSSRAQVIVTDDTPAVTDTTQHQYRSLASLRGGLDIRV